MKLMDPSLLETGPTAASSGKLPHFTLEYRPGAVSGEASGLRIRAENHNWACKRFENEAYLVTVVGHPITGERIDPEGVWRRISAAGGMGVDFLRSLNGEFLLICLDKASRSLKIATDRFASIPMYYLSDSEGLFGSQFYNDLWNRLRTEGGPLLNESAFFEFLFLQRVMGTKTYDSRSRFLPAATCLTYDGKGIGLETYWSPSFRKTRESAKACAEMLADSLKKSIARKGSDGGKRFGLFLSGGMDSRTVLAACNAPPVCFTLAVNRNNEYQVAHEIAAMRGAEHVFIELDPDPYSENLDALVQLGGGMYAFDHALFYGFEDIIAPRVDVAFHGHGIDYMFQGMYVPTEPYFIGGYRTFFLKHRTIGPDFVQDFLENIPFRLKGVDLLDFVKPAQRAGMHEGLRASVREIVDAGRPFCNTKDDLWEYTINHALSRHYPNTNLTSMATCVEQRTVTFDNDVYDLYLSLPAAYKINGKMARMVLRTLNPGLARVRTGNTNIRADFSPLEKQLYRFWDKGLCVSGLRKRTRFYAPAEERTWPDRDRIVRTQPRIRKAALDLVRSDALGSLGFLDMDAISNQVPLWLEKSRGGGALMMFLITLDRFLKQ